MKKTVLAVSFIALTAPAFAQQPPNFSAADTDGDGVVSSAEMKAAMPDMTQEQWDQADADKSGTLTQAEFDQMMQHR